MTYSIIHRFSFYRPSTQEVGMKNRTLKIVLAALLIMQGTAFALSIHPVSVNPFLKSPAPKKLTVPGLHPASKPLSSKPRRYSLLMERILSERERYNAIKISS